MNSEDWVSLYVDGKSIYQAHNINIRHFFAEMKRAGVSTGIDFHDVWVGAQDETLTSENGRLPDTLAELKDTKLP